jgi:NTE family protein
MAAQAREVQTAIVLQGGGALGAYEFGVLRALYEQRPGFRPVAVAGISIGAITAAVLGGAAGDPIRALDSLWRDKLTVAAPVPEGWLPAQIDRSLATFGNPGMYQLQAGLFTAPWLLTSIYDTGPLRHTLAELVDPRRLNDPAPRVIVGAINVGTGEMQYFDNQQPGGLTFDHVAASGSLPPSFPMTPIGPNRYWDGGLFSNTPLAPAINALEAAADGDPAAVRELIVIELFPMKAPIPATFPEVLQRMVELQYTSRLILDKHFFDTIDRVIDLIAQVDHDLPADSPIRTDPLFSQLRAHRKINHLNVVTSNLPPELSNAADFSHTSIEARIQAGYDDATAQGIGQVNAPGLRFGVTRPTQPPAAPRPTRHPRAHGDRTPSRRTRNTSSDHIGNGE